MRQQLNQAVATGGSRGLAAAQALQTAQDASLKTVDSATKLAQDAMALDFEEAAAYKQNARDAEALKAQRQKDLMTFVSGLYDIDERTTVGAMSAAGQYMSGRDYNLSGAQESARADIYGYDKDFDLGIIQDATENYKITTENNTQQAMAELEANTSAKQILANLVINGALTASPELKTILGIPDDATLRNPPKNTYTSGSTGGYTGNTSYNNSSNNLNDNIKDSKAAYAAYNAALASEDRAAAVGALGSILGADAAVRTYDTDKEALRANAKTMTKERYRTYVKNKYGMSTDRADYFWKSYSGAVGVDIVTGH
jgi:hypothetical protein